MLTKVTEKIKARILRQEGLSIKEIAKTLKVAKSSVSIWVRNIKLTSTQAKRLKEREWLGALKGRQKQIEKWRRYRLLHPKISKGPRWPKRTVENFFDSWSPKAAYILGYFSADGCMYVNNRGSCYIGFTSIDQEQIIGIKNMLKISNKIEERPPKSNNKRAYTIQLGSKKIFQKLLSLGLTPNKSLTLKLPNIPTYLIGHFLRGYFDGDGCASLRIFAKKNKLYKTLSIRLTSGSYQFLHNLHSKLIQALDLQGGYIYAKQDKSSELVYSKRDVEKLYNFMYNHSNIFYLKRKQKILKKGLGNSVGL